MASEENYASHGRIRFTRLIVVLVLTALLLVLSEPRVGPAQMPPCNFGAGPDQVRIFPVAVVSTGMKNLVVNGSTFVLPEHYFPPTAHHICEKKDSLSVVTYTAGAIDTKIAAVATDLDRRDTERKQEVMALVERAGRHEARTGDPAQLVTMAALAKRVEELERTVKELQSRP